MVKQEIELEKFNFEKFNFERFDLKKNSTCEELKFLEEMKLMLSLFNISSTKIWLMKGNGRKDGRTTKGLYFKIKQDSLFKFAQEIGFNDRFKNKRLILMEKMGRCP